MSTFMYFSVIDTNLAISWAHQKQIIILWWEFCKLDSNVTSEKFKLSNITWKTAIIVTLALLESLNVHFPSKELSCISSSQNKTRAIDTKSINLFIFLTRSELTLSQF